MESYPFANFVLPVQPSALDTLIVATAFAYSRVWNRRRLENLSYGFWNHLLICLISTLAPNLFFIPQLTIYNAPEPREFPDLSINTVAEKDADERQPDFAIMGTQFRRRDDKKKGSSGFIVPNDFQQWDEIKISAAEPFLLAEIKPPPPRHIDNVNQFRIDLQNILKDATGQAEDQAKLAFNDDVYKMDRMILIVGCGEWWRFMIANRAYFERGGDFFGEMEDEDDTAPAHNRQGKRAQLKRRGPGHLHSVHRHKEIGEEFMEKAEDDIANVMPDENVWSNNIRIGTPASNQRLYSIHNMLGEMKDKLAPPIAEYDSEVRQIFDLVTDPN